LDVVVSGILLLAALPIMLVVGVVIRVLMGPPALYTELRPGLDRRPFRFWKFRSMLSMLPAEGPGAPDAKRITPLGRFLRRTSLDELPQLWLVFKGEMSLVGPRPLRLDYLDYFTPKEELRFSVRPGITGWAQIHGRNRCSWDDRLARDVWYVENWSFWMDIRILLATTWQVVRSQDVVADPASEMLNLDVERRLQASEV
jgi:sugar transferase EpsL